MNKKVTGARSFTMTEMIKQKKGELHLLFTIIAFIEGCFSIWKTLTIPSDSKNSFLLGLSASRLAILAFSVILLVGLLLLLIRIQSFKRWMAGHFNSETSNLFITGLGFVFIALLWFTLGIPSKDFFPFEAFFVRLQPTLLWIELVVIEFCLLVKLTKHSFSPISGELPAARKPLLVFFLILLALWVVLTTTKFGLINGTAFWNVPGIPVSALQFVCITLFILLVLLVLAGKSRSTSGSFYKALNYLLPVIIYAAAVVLWGTTPMLKHFFSLEPSLLNQQPFPYSDARVHDLGAISIVKGDGIYFHGYTDKPLYMVFLAFLHLIAGNNYTLLTWLQICVLAFTPVILFQFGKKFHSTLFGTVLAALVILQQRNAIVLSYKVASANPKLLITEELTLLGLALISYLLFVWMRKKETKTILLIGGILGALSLVRMNPIFILPIVALIVILVLRRQPGQLIKQLALLCAGFLLVFSPWLASGVNPEGKPWFLIKIQDVIQNRYGSDIIQSNHREPADPVYADDPASPTAAIVKFSAAPEVKTPAKESSQAISTAAGDSNLPSIMAAHFVHNFSTSLLALPDTLSLNSLADLSQREYWQDDNKWDGKFSALQFILIVINLAILSIGLSESWKKYRWAGLVPVFIFFAYDFSLSVALNSGSRYIVPINWILFFYYLLGILFLCKVILYSLNANGSLNLETSNTMASEDVPHSRQSLAGTFALLAIIAALIPAANLLAPRLIKPESLDQSVIASVKQVEPMGNQVVSGDILYPYLATGSNQFNFDFLSDEQVQNYQIDLGSGTKTDLESDTPAILSISGQGETKELEAIYLVRNDRAEPFWKKGN